MGAWIEIYMSDGRNVEEDESHPSWVRGLKLSFRMQTVEISTRRTLHGCVD